MTKNHLEIYEERMEIIRGEETLMYRYKYEVFSKGKYAVYMGSVENNRKLAKKKAAQTAIYNIYYGRGKRFRNDFLMY
jgi:hypothetical protein